MKLIMNIDAQVWIAHAEPLFAELLIFISTSHYASDVEASKVQQKKFSVSKPTTSNNKKRICTFRTQTFFDVNESFSCRSLNVGSPFDHKRNKKYYVPGNVATVSRMNAEA